MRVSASFQLPFMARRKNSEREVRKDSCAAKSSVFGACPTCTVIKALVLKLSV